MVQACPVGTAACTLTAENSHTAPANHGVLGLVPGLQGVRDPPPRSLSCPQLYPPASSSRNLPPLGGVRLDMKLGGGGPAPNKAPPQGQAPPPPSPLQLESQSAESEWWQSRRGRDRETSPVWEGDARRPACLKSRGAPGPSLRPEGLWHKPKLPAISVWLQRLRSLRAQQQESPLDQRWPSDRLEGAEGSGLGEVRMESGSWAGTESGHL